MPEFTDADAALLSELGVEAEAKKSTTHTALEERVIAGFEEIQRFVEEHGYVPQHGEGKDIFERIYAVRLDRLRELVEFHPLLLPVDHLGLLSREGVVQSSSAEELNDDALLAALGVEGESSDLTTLEHVRSSAEKRAAEEIANREKCLDFETFAQRFQQVQAEIKSGSRETRPFRDDARIAAGHWFILSGQKCFVAEEGEEFVAEYGRKDRRLRVIFENATETNMLKRSLERALQKDEKGRRITEPSAGPLFSGDHDDEDLASGTIYVLRSKSELPEIAANRELIHKIGVTGGSVEKRIANAKLDPTFLMAEVEIVATYELFNINRTKLENLIHRLFERAQLGVSIKDRFGNPVSPREWFLVPLFVIDEAVERIKDGSITDFVYDPEGVSLVRRTGEQPNRL